MHWEQVPKILYLIKFYTQAKDNRLEKYYGTFLVYRKCGIWAEIPDETDFTEKKWVLIKFWVTDHTYVSVGLFLPFETGTTTPFCMGKKL